LKSDPDISKPRVLLAELTHRCPLGCPYCSNPLALEPHHDELDTATWMRVFREAAVLGIQQANLSGGEPGARHDLVEIAASARDAGLYTFLMTSGVGISSRTMRDLWEAGLDHVQVSIQDSNAVSADYIAGHKGAFQRKYALATEAVRLGLGLSVNFVLHRANIERIGAMVDLALGLKADRVEFAFVQYHGWALRNRSTLMPDREQFERAFDEVAALASHWRDRIVIDCGSDQPGSNPGDGRGRFDTLAVTPSGDVRPLHAAALIAGPEFWNVRDRSLTEIWASSPAFNAIRSMESDLEACAVEERRAVNFGTCHWPRGPQDEPYQYRR
jgi:PqqA peptide cyclase